MNAILRIQLHNAGRDPERLKMKYQRMRSSAFAFLRGTAHLFYDRWATNEVVKSAPLAWICGDLHLENFGSYKGNNRLAYFDLNDFDEAALAPASWDLIRMLTSLRLAAEGLSISQGDIHSLCSMFLNSYTSALEFGKSYWIESETARGVIGRLLTGLRDRQRAQFLATRTVLSGKRRTLKVDGKKALPVSDVNRAAVELVLSRFATTQSRPEFFDVIDVARRIAGTGSLGVDRYAILVRGKGTPNGHYLIDLKQALASSVGAHFAVIQPKWKSEANRIVEIQQRVQAVSMALLQPVKFNGTAYVLRELQPQEDRIIIARSQQTVAELKEIIESMGKLVAWGQLRSSGREGSAIADDFIAFGRRKKWKEKLIAASKDLSLQVKRDSASFNLAYDSGVFSAETSAAT